MRTVKILLASAFALCFYVTSFAQLKVDANGWVGVATTTPARPFEVVGQAMISNNNNYPANKQSNFLMRHYSNQTTHFAYFNAQSDAANNQVLFGGGAGTQYAATVVGFLTAPNNTTQLGTEAMRVQNQQRVRISSTGGGVTHDLTVIGTASKTGGGEWATASDRRVKQDINSFNDGLEKVLKIKPVSFRYKEGLGFDTERTFVGVIAQDMQEVAPYTVEQVEFKPEFDDEFPAGTPTEILSYDGTAVKYMLVNAIQEQQEIIDAQEKQIQGLEARLDRLEALMTGGTTTEPGGATSVTLTGSDVASLSQNRPNPFSEETIVDYTLPQSVKSAAMRITNMQGAVLRVVELPAAAGEGTLTVKTSDFPTGEYFYTLLIDGKVFESKKMVLTK